MKASSLLVLLVHTSAIITISGVTEETNLNFNAVNLRDILRRFSNTGNDIGTIDLTNVLVDSESKSALKSLEPIYMVKEMMSNKKNIESLDVSIPCQAALYQLFSPVLNISSLDPAAILALLGKPVSKVLDAWGKPPSRILLGNLNWIGAYDECKALDKMKYCSSTMFFAMQFTFPGSYGMCFPEQCTAKEINALIPSINKALKGLVILQPNSVQCDESFVYGTGNYLTLIFFGLIGSLLLIGTFTEMLSDSLKTAMKDGTVKLFNESGSSHDVGKFEPDDEEKPIEVASHRILTEPKDVMNRSWIHSLTISFSLIKNTKAILSTDSPKGAITSVNGIRTISMFWVILGHMYFFGSVFGKIDNGLDVANLLHRFTFMAVSNAYVSVDSFFLLSGLLVAYLTFRRMDKENGYPISMVFMGYFHRYIRLTPSIGIVMLFYVNVLPLVLSGPFAIGQFRDILASPCIDYWWTNILYINNFYPTSMGGQCIGWVWYLANDMQFFILSPLILYAMYRLDKRFENSSLQYLTSAGIISALCVISMAVTAILMSVYNLPAVQSANFAGNPKSKNGGKFSDYIYEKPYTRVTPYLVGLYLGYLLHRRVRIKYNLRFIVVLVGWIVSIVTALSVVYGTWKVFRKDNPVFFTDAEDVIYEALHRFAWAVALAWIIYACQNQAGGLVDSFLSWKIWIPLSRLTYGAYLMHPMVLFFFFWSRETVFHYQDNLFVFHIISCTVVSYVCSFILALCIEYPILNLEKKLLG